MVNLGVFLTDIDLISSKSSPAASLSDFVSLTGASITIHVLYSKVMKRQYLNVAFTPTATFTGQTEGLCGFMDDNSTNDFKGPDQKLYKDAVEFGDSCT